MPVQQQRQQQWQEERKQGVTEEGSDIALPPGPGRVRMRGGGGGGREGGREGGIEWTQGGAITAAVFPPALFPLAPRTVDVDAALPLLLLLRSPPDMRGEGGKGGRPDDGVGVGVEGGIEEEEEEEEWGGGTTRALSNTPTPAAGSGRGVRGNGGGRAEAREGNEKGT